MILIGWSRHKTLRKHHEAPSDEGGASPHKQLHVFDLKQRHMTGGKAPRELPKIFTAGPMKRSEEPLKQKLKQARGLLLGGDGTAQLVV